jgi:hypothetical protein
MVGVPREERRIGGVAGEERRLHAERAEIETDVYRHTQEACRGSPEPPPAGARRQPGFRLPRETRRESSRFGS